MTTAVKADRGRLTIRGVKNGQTYIVQKLDEGWLVVPEPQFKPSKPNREWDGPRHDLSYHLDALAKEGLEFKRTMGKEAPPCRF